MKAFIFDPLWDELVTPELKDKLESISLDVHVKKEIAPLSECVELFEGNEERILCLNPDYVSWKLTNEDYKDIPSLKGIFTISTSFAWIEQEVADEHDIPVCNIRNFSTQAVAEWAITMMLNLARQTPRLIKDSFPLDYDKDFIKYRGVQLKGKTAGIIGLGHNGSAIAERCTGLGMEVIYWSRASRNDAYTYVELDGLMKTADVIFPAFAKNSESLSLINEELLHSMKPTAILVDIIEMLDNNSTILDMIKTNKLFGYGFEAKPGAFNQYEGNVWAAPAYAWVTYDSMYNSEVKLIENIINAAGGKFPNRVN